MTIYRKVGINIYKNRIRMKLTQNQLSEKSGVSVKYLQNLESAKPKRPTLETLEKIATALEIDLSRLLKF